MANVDEGGGPFGAVVVKDGELVAIGQNRVTRDLDPTAHAEVLAIRSACAELGDFALTGCSLYASCEPCPLCVSAALWSRVDRVVYAADRDDAARGGFDDRAFYDLFAHDRCDLADAGLDGHARRLVLAVQRVVGTVRANAVLSGRRYSQVVASRSKASPVCTGTTQKTRPPGSCRTA